MAQQRQSDFQPLRRGHEMLPVVVRRAPVCRIVIVVVASWVVDDYAVCLSDMAAAARRTGSTTAAKSSTWGTWTSIGHGRTSRLGMASAIAL
jgi:hypothetical protein